LARAPRGSAHRLQAGEAPPQQAADRAQRLARPPHKAQASARRDLAPADGGEHVADRRGDLRRRTHAGEIDAEPLAGVGLAGRRQR